MDENLPVADAPAPAVGAVAETPAAAVAALVGDLRGSLAELRQQLDADPFANPIKLLSLELLGRLRRDELDDRRIEALVQRLTLTAFEARAARMRAYVGELDEGRNAARVAGLIRALAHAGEAEGGGLLPFAAFKERAGAVAYGFVFTAHPTFGLSLPLMDRLAALAFGLDGEGRALDEAALAAVLDEAEAMPHRPERMDLAAEHAMSLRVIANGRAAVRTVHKIALGVARELYPEQWQELVPRLVTLASWVGYDTDGRSDIRWSTTFAKRLRVQVEQLAYHRDGVRALREGAEGEGGLREGAKGEPALLATLELLETRLDLAIKTAEDDLAVLGADDARDATWQGRLARVSREMAGRRAGRLTDARQVVELVERALGAAREPATVEGLCLLRAELATQGLTAARTHVRINAVQLHNAVRKSIGMEHAPDDPTHRLSYLQATARLAAEARPVTVNFGTIEAEKATATRVFMTMAQMLKHLDASEPVRFLIAECDNALTLVAALYFARLFDIDGRIDISPLFETRKALERGASIIAEAIRVPAYRAYLERRGRLCIQTGFSDAGRYMGQTAACVAIERVRLGLVELLAREGLGGLELVIFDTHGESIGRGAHPGSFADRLRYYDTPESRRRLARAGTRLVEESSYQGGDGYLYFLNPSSAFALVTRALEHCLTPPEAAADPFYAASAYVDEFFAAVSAFNAAVIDDPCYAAFLGAYGVNLVYPTGSRALKRQEAGARPAADLAHPSQLRAIPHNSILQQMGILANTIGGVGQAVDKDPDAFRRLYRDSERFRRLVAMVEHAFKFTDLDVVKAYLDLFDPEGWLRLARRAADSAGQEEGRAVADRLERLDVEDRLARVFRIFHRDYMDLARAFRAHRRAARESGERPIAVDPETRDTLHLLHALRLALIQRLMLRAVHLPDFSDRHAATHDGLIARLMHLDVEPALDILAEIFPITEDAAAELDWGEPASYRGSETQSYVTEHVTLFRPIRRDYELIRRISTGVSHYLGAVG